MKAFIISFVVTLLVAFAQAAPILTQVDARQLLTATATLTGPPKSDASSVQKVPDEGRFLISMSLEYLLVFLFLIILPDRPLFLPLFQRMPCWMNLADLYRSFLLHRGSDQD